MDKLRMGILGCSAHYFKRIALPLRESLLVEPYAIASRDGAKAAAYAKEWGLLASYGSYEELLKDTKVDFIYNPLPNHMHLPWIKKAADAGLPTLCEKPLGLNAPEAVEAASYCKKKGVLLMEAFMYRFHPQWRRTSDLVRASELGKVMTTHGLFFYDNKDPRNIRNVADFGGGALLDIGCYAISTARLLMAAEPERVVCSLLRDPEFKTDVMVSGLLDFGSGRHSTFSVGTQLFPAQKVEAYGTGGSLAMEIPFNMYGDVPGRVSIVTSVGRRVVETEIVDQYLLQFDAFAQALLEKTEAPIPLSDTISNMAVLDALITSAQSGSWEKVLRY